MTRSRTRPEARRSTRAWVAAAVSASVFAAGHRAAAQQHATASQSVADIPITGPHASLGNRVAQARADFENLEFEHALALLRPLRTVTDLQPAVAIDAALLETAIYSAQHLDSAALDACKRAVIAAGNDPGVAAAHQQSPRVQTACGHAAEQVRRDLVAQRHMVISQAAVEPGDVAWTAVRIQAHFDGDLSGLDARADVTINGGAPITVNLPATGGSVRAATLEAGLATPDARIEAVPYVRDAHGVLLRAEHASRATVPTAEAAVQFSRGSDEGPLSIDGQPSSAQVRIGETVPMRVGPHVLEVRNRAGATARATLSLRRGEIASVSLHATQGIGALDVVRWTSTVAAVAALATGGVFRFLAIGDAQSLSVLSTQKDPATGLPTVQWDGPPRQLAATMATEQALSTGLFIGGGVAAVVAIVTWAIPRPAATEAAPRVAWQLTPGVRDLSLSLRF